MSLTLLLTRPITIVRKTESGTEDEYGNQTDFTTNVETVGELQQQQRAETNTMGLQQRAGDVAQTTWLLILHPDENLDASDLVTVDGDEFEVVGPPWMARNPRTGDDHHIEATLRRTGGVGE